MNIEKIFKRHKPNKEFVIINDDPKQSYYIDGTPVPNQEEINALKNIIQNEESLLDKYIQWTPVEFLERFTQIERVNILDSSKKDSLILDYLYLITSSEIVSSHDSLIINYLNYLKSKNLINEQRKQEILA